MLILFAILTIFMFFVMVTEKVNVKCYTVAFCVSMAITAAVYLIG